METAVGRARLSFLVAGPSPAQKDAAEVVAHMPAGSLGLLFMATMGAAVS